MQISFSLKHLLSSCHQELEAERQARCKAEKQRGTLARELDDLGDRLEVEHSKFSTTLCDKLSTTLCVKFSTTLCDNGTFRKPVAPPLPSPS